MEFKQLLAERRSAVNFLEDVDITKEELDQIFEQTKNYPSFFNLQHAHYYVSYDRSKREGIYKAINQHKAFTASACILVCGNLYAYKDAEQIYAGMKMLKIMDELEYTQTIEAISGFHARGGQRFLEDEALRNSMLSAMIFMLAAKEMGWDTCPVHGLDMVQVKKEFGVKPNHVPTMLITLGKSDPKKLRPRGYRKPVAEFVHYTE